ncbi:MAG: hypothetical protein R2730_17115 [Chitinophagales bacterium]
MIKSFKTKKLIQHIDQSILGRNKSKEARNIHEVQSIGIVLDGRDQSFVDAVTQYAEQQEKEGKKVTLLSYLPKVGKQISLGIPFFTKEDINWYYKPVKESVLSFIDQPFDLLLNFCPDKLLPLESVIALSSAKFIIGNGLAHLNSYYDILLKLNNSNAPDSFIENVHHYLTLQG